jgi:hypothetical protein
MQFIEQALYDAAKQPVVSITLGLPERIPRGWRCEVQVVKRTKGRQTRERETGFGVDPVQALGNAIGVARDIVNRRYRKLYLESGRSAGLAFPRYVPTVFGKAFVDLIDRTIDREIEKILKGRGAASVTREVISELPPQKVRRRRLPRSRKRARER